jgi:hypothetical protein
MDMDDTDMKTSYMLKPAEVYQAQLNEDKSVEEFWGAKFRQLARD